MGFRVGLTPMRGSAFLVLDAVSVGWTCPGCLSFRSVHHAIGEVGEVGGIGPTLSPSPGPRFTLVRPALSSLATSLLMWVTEDRPQEASAEGRRFAGSGQDPGLPSPVLVQGCWTMDAFRGGLIVK